MPGRERGAIPNVVRVEDFKARRAAELEKARLAEEARIARELTDTDSLLDYDGIRGNDGPHPDTFALPAEKF